MSGGAKGFVARLFETNSKKQTGVVRACKNGCILTEDGDTYRHLLDNPVMVGMGGGEYNGGRKKMTALEGVSIGDCIGIRSDRCIIDVGNVSCNSRKEVFTTASSFSPTVPQ